MTDVPAHQVELARAGTYGLLARLVLSEIDETMLEPLAAMPLLGTSLAESGGSAGLGGLRAEYTRTFLMTIHPYESVYLDESGMLNSPASGAVLEHYRAHGYEPGALRTAGAPDHLGLELGYMADLIERAAAADRIGNAAVASALRDEQLHFLADHLLRWAPIFGHLLTQAARAPFYRTLGAVIESFILGDYEALTVPER